MISIKQKVRNISPKTIVITSLVPLGLLAISSAQAADKNGGGGGVFCPCFTSTIIDATLAEGHGSGLRGLLDGTDGSFSCEDTGEAVNLRFNNADHSVSISVFGELSSGSLGPGCGWSGRPLDTTRQEASECQNQIKQSWAWKVLNCPNL